MNTVCHWHSSKFHRGFLVQIQNRNKDSTLANSTSQNTLWIRETWQLIHLNFQKSALLKVRQNLLDWQCVKRLYKVWIDALRTSWVFSIIWSVESVSLETNNNNFMESHSMQQFRRVWNNHSYFCSFGRNHGDEHLAAGEIVEGRESSSSSMTLWSDHPQPFLILLLPSSYYEHCFESNLHFDTVRLRVGIEATNCASACSTSVGCVRFACGRLVMIRVLCEELLRTSVHRDICSVSGWEITHMADRFLSLL